MGLRLQVSHQPHFCDTPSFSVCSCVVTGPGRQMYKRLEIWNPANVNVLRTRHQPVRRLIQMSLIYFAISWLN